MAVAVLGILVLGVNVGGLALLLRGGISASVDPTAIEAAVAGKLRRVGIPGSFRQLRSPVPPRTKCGLPAVPISRIIARSAMQTTGAAGRR